MTRASYQPFSGVHSTVNMWSVKWVPKPGLARISDTSASLRGCSDRVMLMSSGMFCILGLLEMCLRLR